MNLSASKMFFFGVLIVIVLIALAVYSGIVTKQFIQEPEDKYERYVIPD